ncbi:MAG TPA: protein kinase [Thermoanaerobaculia bacterium]|nr:protein kinase [Thermoanaerobaculia bacterium]
MTDDASLPPGSVISHYRLVGKIGAGGMGEVYRAEDTTLHRPVAIKVLSAGVLESVDRVRRFVQEARAASALNHPNIVTIYEIGQARLELDENTAGPPSSDPIHYIAMEFIEGETLRAAIKKKEDTKTLLSVLAQVAEGLSKAHNAGIIHRDLKPDNIMITSDGYAKVVDFGLAKLTEKRADAAAAEKTQEGMVMGTVGYMSPEQVHGAHVDERSDIFALGCILYEIVAGKRAFQSDSVIDTMHKIIFSEPPEITEISAGVSPNITRIISRCLVKDPEGRYPSVRELAIDLRRALAQTPLMPVDEYAPTIAVRAPHLEEQVSSSEPGQMDIPSVQPASGERPRLETKRAARSFPVAAVVRWTLILSVLAAGVILWRSFPAIENLPDEQARIAAAGAAAQRAGAADFAWTSSSNMAPTLRRSVLVTQDPQFFERPVLRTSAQWTLALRQGLKRRKFDVLPSPVTVHLAEQLYFTPTNPIRKVESWLAAWPMERLLSRKQTMELYLNSAPIGNTVGVEAAAQKFFDKPASAVTTRQSAALIASIGQPSGNPGAPDGALTDAQQSILDKLKGAGYLDEPKSAGAKSKKSAGAKVKNTAPASDETGGEAAAELDAAAPPPTAAN